jgi:flavin reductase (DIM6/NTAB) family NADH-FMN oxidoreductase RutF
MNTPYIADAVVEAAVGLILTEAEGRSNAMTISFFSEAAHWPTTMWVSIAKSSYTHHLMTTSGRFSVVMLYDKQHEFAESCGTVSGRYHDKTRALGLDRTETGDLFLPDSLASVICRVRRTCDLNDHTLVIGDILGGWLNSQHLGRRHLLLSDLDA